jgi:hypothetical protein
MLASSSNATVRAHDFMLPRGLRPAGEADDVCDVSIQTSCVCVMASANMFFFHDSLKEHSPRWLCAIVDVGFRGCASLSQGRRELALAPVAVQPTVPKMAATTHQSHFSGHHRRRTTSTPAIDRMPGKHVASATSDLCDRCKENISVLVVRSKPLCQSVRPRSMIHHAKIPPVTVLRGTCTRRLSNAWRVFE